MPESVVLLDADGNETGRMDKLAAHQGHGHLHRAFSVFLVDADGRLLLQRRASSKHHFRDLWTNACCSHPRPGEDVLEAGVRRVGQELGVTLDQGSLREVGSFIYRARDDESGLVEHEWDHVLVGRFEGEPDPDPAEVGDWRWVDRAALDAELAADPASFTPWFSPALAVLDHARG
jgi:isopentenyl-diphosphate Delta-isomerase